jgi:hypothetical protein
MTSGYTEDKLVEQPAIDLFHLLNWKTYNAYDEVLGEEGDLSRETTEEVVLSGVLERETEAL